MSGKNSPSVRDEAKEEIIRELIGEWLLRAVFRNDLLYWIR